VIYTAVVAYSGLVALWYLVVARGTRGAEAQPPLPAG
jgi:hypothetical protein